MDAIVRELAQGSEGKTPTVKDFAPDWVATLATRGEPVVYTRRNSRDFDFIGMPIGGIGAGQLYLGGDGKLWCWDIFNTKGMRDVRGVPTHARPYKRSEPDRRAHHQIDQGFAVRVTTDGKTVTRRLDRDGFRDIEFRGQYPIGFVKYADAGLPVRVELEAFSPFVPLDLDSSTYPATVLEYTVTNTSDREASCELYGWLANAVCIKSQRTAAGQRRNRVVRKPNMTMVTFDAAKPEATRAEKEPRPEIVFEDFEGDLSKWTAEGDAFEGNPKPNFHHQPLRGHRGKGLADSFRNAGKPGASAPDSDRATGKLTSAPFTIERKAIRSLIGGGRHAGQTCLNLVVDGKVVRSATGENSETLSSKVFNVVDLEGKKAHLEIVDSHRAGWGHVLVDHIVFSDDTRAESPPLERLPDFGSMCLALLDGGPGVKASASSRSPEEPFRDETATTVASLGARAPVGAVGKAFRLRAGERAVLRFVLAWHFPNYFIPRLATETGRSYGTRFASAQAVADEIAERFATLCERTRLWHRTWYDSTLPWWFLDRTFLNTSILATNTCFLFRDGRFYGYEGVYHGHGTCTHVWGYVQAPGRLFPELERRLRERADYKLGVGFDPRSGAIRHRGEFGAGIAADGQSGTILRTYLAHQMSPDDAFLKRVYPAMKKAMGCMTHTFDADRDGILTGGQHNTLDAKWYGKITWLSLHYTAALRAAAAMADEMADGEYAQQCRAIADRGRKYIEDKLFNGEYFFHEADPEHPKSPGVFNGIEYSQLLGQSWAYQVGLGRILDPAKASTHLRSLWKYNFTTDVGPFREKFRNGRWYAMPGEGGLIACTWPKGGQEALLHGSRHFAGYLNECQPGYEWAATSLMMWHGMPYHALAHTRTMHERYHGSKRNPWNEVEWGSHYSRSMASYGVFTAACGFEYHGPKGYMAFAPRISSENFKAAFTSAQAWGTFSQTRKGTSQTEAIEVKWGRLRLKTLAFDVPEAARVANVALGVGDNEAASTFRQDGTRVRIALKKQATADREQRITVLLDW